MSISSKRVSYRYTTIGRNRLLVLIKSLGKIFLWKDLNLSGEDRNLFYLLTLGQNTFAKVVIGHEEME